MFISNNPILNILTSNDNKVLKDVLKQADSQTLEQMAKNSNSSVVDVLKNLFDDLKSGNKTNSTIQNILKNNPIFKELGEVTNNLQNLAKDLDENSNLQKYKPLLENFLKNISTLDEKTLKEQISNSGVFLESKIAKSGNENSLLPQKLQNTLMQLKETISTIQPSTNATKQLSEQIDKLLSNANKISNPQNLSEQSSNLKNLITNLQNFAKNLTNPQTQNISNLTTKLENIINQGSLVESNMENELLNPANNIPKEKINIETKELLTQIKSEISKLPILDKNINSKIDNLLKLDNFFGKNEILNQDISTPKILNNNLQNLLTNLKENINLLQNNPNNLEAKAEISKIVEKIENSLDSEINNLPKIAPETKDLLSQIKNELSKMPNIDKNILTKIDTLLTKLVNETPNANIISSFSNNFSTNLDDLLTTLKDTISTFEKEPTNIKLQNEISKIVEKIEQNIKEHLTNNIDNKMENKEDFKNLKNSDIKSILLQIKEELTTQNDTKSQESLKQVDKLLNSLDYHQLQSLTNNSNSVYLPFLWDMLEDGTIDMKKTDEDKFYCQINLTLKDFGKVDLMLGLYDKNKLDLTIYAQREHFKTAIKDNIQQLKQALNKANLIPVNIKLLDMKDESKEDSPINIYENNNSYLTNSLNNIDIRA